MAFTALVVFMGRWGWTLVVFYSVCSLNGALALCVWHLDQLLLAFVCFDMFSVCGCLRVSRIGAQASPSHENLLSDLGVRLGGPFGLALGGSWLEGAGLPAMGA